jgi:hypothetical protein
MTKAARLLESSSESLKEYKVGGEGCLVGASGAKGAMLTIEAGLKGR